MSRSVEVGASLEMFPPVLDATCGTRSMWFDRRDPRALFIDERCVSVPVDIGTPGTIGRSDIIVAPDIVADFTAMPFRDNTFYKVVFDPPHVQRTEPRGAVTRRYGCLNGNWREMLRKGFAECFRVLRPYGTLTFKWGESQFKVREILALTPHKPMYGHHTSKTSIWVEFMKVPGEIA